MLGDVPLDASLEKKQFRIGKQLAATIKFLGQIEDKTQGSDVFEILAETIEKHSKAESKFQLSDIQKQSLSQAMSKFMNEPSEYAELAASYPELLNQF